MKRIEKVMAFLVGLMLLAGCKQSSGVSLPEYSNITITPQKEVYHVGDKVRCSIVLTEPGSDNLQKATYWFYANWWFSDPDMTADFQTFANQDGRMVATSSEIELTKAAKLKTDQNGQAEICFYGRLEYPEWDFRKVEIRVPVKVVE